MGATHARTPIRIERSDILGRYYTKHDIGAALVAHMGRLTPTHLLDLGSGTGSLSYAALSQWRDVRLLTVDIDAQSRQQISKLLPADARYIHRHICADALCSDLPNILSARFERIDTGVCNPPFITPRWRRGFAAILEDAGFSNCLPVIREANAALLFLAQNLRVLSPHATLGIILPDTLMSGVRYEPFRRELLRRYCVHKAVRLPRYSFQGTDALAHILIVSKGAGTQRDVSLQLLDVGLSSDESMIRVDPSRAAVRLDFLYHSSATVHSTGLRPAAKLGDICTDVSRGTLTTGDVRSSGIAAFHTTDINCAWMGSWKNLPDSQRASSRVGIAVQAGDILMARVGRNLQKKIIGVNRGGIEITDCLYRIRVPTPWQRHVLADLTSVAGQRWLESRIHGVSARQLTKADLLQFPVRKPN